ncbi:MAG: hypothetical protein H0T80_11720 [Betaproteobacteria bacterium]|nr:hypothetical protein [Betaproteobacteria bacterium]
MMTLARLWSFIASGLGIIIAGAIGGAAGWAVVAWLQWTGVGGALVAAAVGMVVATGVWIGLTVVLRALRLLR